MQQHEFDQLQACLADMAKMLAEYHQKLIKEGFDPFQALQLTISFQIKMIENTR